MNSRSRTDSEADDFSKIDRSMDYLFKVIDKNIVEDVDNNKSSVHLKVEIDKRISVGLFKLNLEPYFGRRSRDFRVFKDMNGTERDLNSSYDPFGYTDNVTYIVREGISLREGEFRTSFFKLDLENFDKVSKSI